MKTIEIIPTPLHGAIHTPPSKSLCHRAIIAASMAEGTSTIKNVILSDDIQATIEAVQALGAKVTIKDDTAVIRGSVLQKAPGNYIDCKESGSTLRFIIPLGLLSEQEISYSGKGNLMNRPLGPYIDIFIEQDIHFSSPALPMNISGKLKPGIFKLKGDISSQFITGLMFALPVLKADSTIHLTSPLESKGYIDMTIDMLNDFGIMIKNEDYKSFMIEGNQCYHPIHHTVEGDYSQAAFWIAAGLLSNKIECMNLSIGSKQGDKAFIDFMRAAGGKIDISTSAITASPSSLKGFQADVSQCPDIAPILAVAAAVAEGESHIIGASRLRLKECDRLAAIAVELNKLGAEVIEKEDSLIIKGKEMLHGGEVDSWGDHRIAMALSIASIRCTSPVIIKNSNVITKSYPGFYKDFITLGGIINERMLG